VIAERNWFSLVGLKGLFRAGDLVLDRDLGRDHLGRRIEALSWSRRW